MPAKKRSSRKRTTSSKKCCKPLALPNVVLSLLVLIGVVMTYQSYQSFTLSDRADQFWSFVQDENYPDAYEMMSSAFRLEYSRERFRALMEGARLHELTEIHWSGRSFFEQEEEIRGMAMLGEQSFPHVTSFVREKGELVVSGYHFDGLQIYPDLRSIPKPSELEARKLMKAVSNTFLSSKKLGNYMDLYRMMPLILQARMSEGDLRDRLSNGDVPDFSGSSMNLLANELTENKELLLRGVYDSDPAVLVNYKFVGENGTWKIVDMGFYVLSNAEEE